MTFNALVIFVAAKLRELLRKARVYFVRIFLFIDKRGKYEGKRLFIHSFMFIRIAFIFLLSMKLVIIIKVVKGLFLVVFEICEIRDTDFL